MGRIRFQWCINPDPFREGVFIVALMTLWTRRPVRIMRNVAGRQIPGYRTIHTLQPVNWNWLVTTWSKTSRSGARRGWSPSGWEVTTAGRTGSRTENCSQIRSTSDTGSAGSGSSGGSGGEKHL